VDFGAHTCDSAERPGLPTPRHRLPIVNTGVIAGFGVSTCWAR
jgi:hypothetical protein